LSLEVWLYGSLRRFALEQRVTANSVVRVEAGQDDTIEQVLASQGIQPEEVSNIFLDGELSAITRRVGGGSRLGVFPWDMALLYKWYFEKKP